MRIAPLCVAIAAALALVGCRSPYIATAIVNRTGQPLSVLELDYPSASFGADSLAPDATYRYRFQVLGNGPTTLLWTDSAHHDHKVTGPSLREGDVGSLTITLTPGSAPAWDLRLANRPAN